MTIAEDIHEKACREGKDYYFDPRSGGMVFTAHYLSKQGKCCGNGCRHCPYELKER